MIPTALSKTSRSLLTRVLKGSGKPEGVCVGARRTWAIKLRVFGPVANAYRPRRTFRTSTLKRT